ncbi:adenine nucleotide alpha hydrolases-like protein [Aulographum hederae CBS 113979]|uniref:Diphthine--ammonia ligase n=1 Tax=Aulographum hederae CBS 113979 TaxID=1176131 RepID=A0A6G1GUU9_9PEZI|nr:adenine nucleotide alpha hydrolases-like protein [Aulographum hederae CBS 113979]
MATQSLNVIALISGGKDSFFSILHCLANGHKIVALANLHPPLTEEASQNKEEGEDINSYMYQTVGHSIIPLYEEALGIPLFRQPIFGSAVNTSKNYAPPPAAPSSSSDEVTPDDIEPDETESLTPLLKRIITAHPNANALSTGAILSHYQRTRVESVALRLGLTPLSFLWQYPYLPPYRQASLLHDMRTVAQDARIIKVASGGLDEGFLWENVAEGKVVGRLEKRMERFGLGGGAVLGEGGEFETLALDGPGVLWRKRIEVKGQEVMKGDGGSATVKLTGARTVEKGDVVGPGLGDLRIPDLLDDEFKTLLGSLDSIVQFSGSRQPASPPPLVLTMDDLGLDTINEHSTLCYLSNYSNADPSLTSAAQFTSIVNRLKDHLAKLYDATPSAIISTTLLLRSMADFTVLNPIYGSIFPDPDPPARVTIACGDALPEGCNVVLSAVVSTDEETTSNRRGLHVQGRSYWAPANIGPYSQSVSFPLDLSPLSEERGAEVEAETRLVHLAGQIPLVPASMEIVQSLDSTPNNADENFRLQTVLSLQHLWRIGRAMDVAWFVGGVAYISACEEDGADRRAGIALKAWEEIHRISRPDQFLDEADDEADIDPWDLKNRVGSQTGSGRRGDGVGTGDQRSRIPDYSKLLASSLVPSIPPAFVIQVDALPRGADIEWTTPAGIAPTAPIKFASETFKFIPLREDQFGELVGLLAGEDEERHWVVYTTGPLRRNREGEDVEGLEGWCPMVVPCRRIWGRDGEGRGSRFYALLVGTSEV